MTPLATDAPSADTGPGFLAFLAFFLLALALWFLMRNMNARMRRMSYRQNQAGRGKDDPQADGSEPSSRDDDGRGGGADHGDGGGSSDGGGSDGGGGGGD